MTKRILRIAVVWMVGWVLLVGSSGCKNTAHGAGKDIENMGEKIQEKTK